MASGVLPKSPVSSSLCDEVPHIFIPKSHLEPREILISSAKDRGDQNALQNAISSFILGALNNEERPITLAMTVRRNVFASLLVSSGHCTSILKGFRIFRSEHSQRTDLISRPAQMLPDGIIG